MLDFIPSIFLYIFLCIISIFIAKKDYKKQKNGNKLSIISIFIISLLFTIYNVFITKTSISLSGDRQNYLYAFNGIRESSSVGLAIIINVIKSFTNEVEILYYASTFITMLVTLLAYRKCKEATPNSLAFIFTTQYVLFTFAGLKQCYANAFAALSIITALQKEKVKDILLSILFAIIAIFFHPTAYILIPILLLVLTKKSKVKNIVLLLLLVAIILSFEQLISVAGNIIEPYIPELTTKINQYIGENANDALGSTGRLAILKGIPFYIISIIAWINRDKLKDKIKNYDNYMVISIIASTTFITSFYNAWIYRLSYYFYLPTAILFANIIDKSTRNNNTKLIKLLIFGTSTLLTLRYVFLIYSNYGGF